MKLIALAILAGVAVPEPTPLVLDAKAQMALAQYISQIEMERVKAQEEAVYWYLQWKNKKGVCI